MQFGNIGHCGSIVYCGNEFKGVMEPSSFARGYGGQAPYTKYAKQIISRGGAETPRERKIVSVSINTKGAKYPKMGFG
jgi:hypothetical protein